MGFGLAILLTSGGLGACLWREGGGDRRQKIDDALSGLNLRLQSYVE